MHKITNLNKDINKQLREQYLDMLAGGIGGGHDKTKLKPVRNLQGWKDIPPCDAIDIASDNIWVWSDLHFNHTNIIQYSNRPFQDVNQMTEHLIANFNDYVKPGDVSIWVGDITFSNVDISNRILDRCNGYKILVVGNHDYDRKNLKKMSFNETHIVYNLKIDDNLLLFTHYPLIKVPEGATNIHGHQHIGSTPIESAQHINVNCEFHNYKPLNLQTIGDWIEKRKV